MSITPDLVEWLVSDPEVAAAWREIARGAGLRERVPGLEVTRRTRRTDRHRLKELLEVWRCHRPDTFTLHNLLNVLDGQGLKSMSSFLRLMTDDKLGAGEVRQYVQARLRQPACYKGLSVRSEGRLTPRPHSDLFYSAPSSPHWWSHTTEPPPHSPSSSPQHSPRPSPHRELYSSPHKAPHTSPHQEGEVPPPQKVAPVLPSSPQRGGVFRTLFRPEESPKRGPQSLPEYRPHTPRGMSSQSLSDYRPLTPRRVSSQSLPEYRQGGSPNLPEYSGSPGKLSSQPTHEYSLTPRRLSFHSQPSHEYSGSPRRLSSQPLRESSEPLSVSESRPLTAPSPPPSSTSSLELWMRELPTIREGGRTWHPKEGEKEGAPLEGRRRGAPRPYSSVCSLQAWGGGQGKGRMGTDKYFDNLVAMIEESTRGLEL